MKGISQLALGAAFDLFQFWAGGTVAKRHLVLGHYSNQKRVLEVGCSVGNIAAVFPRDVHYLGVDTDEGAINYARRKFAHRPGFSFMSTDLRNLRFEQAFDFIVFSGIVHHLDDATAIGLIECSGNMLSPEGTVLVSDPIQPTSTDSTIIKLYRKLERGRYVRTLERLSALMTQPRNLEVVRRELHSVAALPFFKRPIVSNFGVLVLTPSVDT
jgi:2-polyprenyl-3-methyl-5-hydroxy-6-metoxy-1,4-benzoquinol methylase